MKSRIAALSVYILSRVLPAGASMALMLLCIRELSPEEYARYSVIMLASGLASGFIGGVSAQPMLRYACELSARTLRRALIGVPLIGAMLTVPIVLVYLGTATGWSLTLMWVAALVPLVALIDTRRSMFVARGLPSAVFWLDLVRSSLALIIGAALFTHWESAITAPLAGQTVAAAIVLFAVRPRVDDGPHGCRSIDQGYFRYGLGVAGWMVVMVGISLGERLVVNDAIGMAGSGRYAAQADAINAIFSAGVTAIAFTVMPNWLALVESKNRQSLNRLLQWGVLGCIFLASICFLVGALLTLVPSSRIAQTLIADIPIATTLVVASMVWSIGIFVQKPIELRGDTWRLFVVAMGVLLFFVVVASIAATVFGALGVAFAKLLAGLVYVGAVAFMVRSA